MGTSETSGDLAYDIVGIGFGPSNLALAAAIQEYNHERALGPGLRAAFLERQEQFGWHTGMLLDGALMQVCFLKDLVTLRRPVSEFSFLNYLHQCGRLPDFVNHKILYPTRREFHEYLEWAAARLSHLVTYDAEVVDIRPVAAGDRVTHLDVVVRRRRGHGPRVILRTRNLVVGAGLTPVTPPGVRLSSHVWHSAEFLHRIQKLPEESAQRFLVVGAGQSAAEVVAYLHDRFGTAEVHAVFSRYGYSPMDDSSFVNQIFDADAVDDFYNAPQPVKEAMLRCHSNTNYSVVDSELISRLYAKSYAETVAGRRRLFFHRLSQVSRAVSADGRVEVDLADLARGTTHRIIADALIYATGYKPADPFGLLGSAAGLCERDSEGRVRVERDYRVVTGKQAECGIYLQGSTEHCHGISSSLLSNIATRAGEIMESLAKKD